MKCKCESMTITLSLSLTHPHTHARTHTHTIIEYIMASDSPWNITNKDFSHYFAFYHEIVPDGELLSGSMLNTHYVYSYDFICRVYVFMFHC